MSAKNTAQDGEYDGNRITLTSILVEFGNDLCGKIRIGVVQAGSGSLRLNVATAQLLVLRAHQNMLRK